MLYGRDAERARISALLEAARSSRGGTLVLRGEAGIGKSALLEDARERASDMHVLSARGVESESELPFAALHQLLRPALAHVDRLPPPQAAELRSALGFDAGGGQERFLVFSACLSLLSELAEQRPVLCLVDDAHWLDAASADALQFVARRLDAEGIVFLFAAREGDVREFEAADLPSLTLAGLDPQAAALLLGRGDVEIAPSVREELLARTRGNALALVELPSALSVRQLVGDEPLPAALPLTQELESVFHERVARLPAETRRLLVVAAADDTEDAGVVRRAAATLGLDPNALAGAERSGLVVLQGTKLGFRHPLVRSAVYGAATWSERRSAHAALAEALAGDDGRADRRTWHLASAAVGYDEGVARALEEAAERAQGRAAYMAAAKALDRAAEASVDEEGRGRRLVAAARSARIAGADEYAVELANRALPLVDAPSLRAEAAYAIGLAEFRRGRPADGVSKLIDAARGLAPTDARRALEPLIWATGAASIAGDVRSLGEVSQVAASLASTTEDGLLFVAEALAAVAGARQTNPEPAAERLEAAFDYAAAADDAQHVFAVAVAALFVGDQRRFETLISRATSLARERGELGVLAEALTIRAAQLLLVQHYDEAALSAAESAQFARDLGAANLAARPLAILAVCAAIRGDEQEVSRLADYVRQLAAAHGLPLHAATADYALALLDLGRGRWAEALERLEKVAGLHAEAADPFLARFAAPNLVEAAVRAGRDELARAALATFEAWASSPSSAWAQPVAASCRALLAHGAEATAQFEEALRLAEHARPLDLARIQLLYGEHLRRVRRRADARLHLRAAIDGFERLRAEPWAERARTELRASGETARKRDPSTISQLTPQELQVARFVAEGLTNKEIAAQLYLSPRTIDSHLRNVFSKLGITSRTQLARLPLGDEEAVTAVGA